MPRVLIPENITIIKRASLLVSGDLNYFMTYGIPLVRSHINNKISSALIINCVNFKLSMASAILLKSFAPEQLKSIFLTKTSTDNIECSPERKMCYLRTIRYYVAEKIRQVNNSIDLIIADIDSLFISETFNDKYKDLEDSDISFAVGATINFVNEPFTLLPKQITFGEQ